VGNNRETRYSRHIFWGIIQKHDTAGTLLWGIIEKHDTAGALLWEII